MMGKIKIITIGFILLALSLKAKAQQITHQDSVSYSHALKYMYGINTPLDYDKAIRIFRTLAKKRFAEAYSRLAFMEQNGFGVNRNEEKALNSYQIADKLGSMSGSFGYAYCLKKGIGTMQNYEMAFNLFDSCANLGHTKSMYVAGEMLYKGYGTKQNYNKAITYFERGAKEANKECLYMLGAAHAEGFGVVRNIEKSKDYFMQAMIKGHGWVEDVIANNILDSVTIAATNRVPANIDITNNLNLIINNINENDIADSYWKGTFTTYDWSGKYVAQEKTVKVWLNKEFADTINVVWKEFTADEYSFKIFKNDDKWQVKDFEQTLKFRNNYTTKGILLGRIDETKIHGVLYNYSNSTKDRMMPSYFVLTPITDAIYKSQTENFTITKIFPNPFKDRLKLYIELKANDKLSIEIYNTLGQKTYYKSATNYETGNFSIGLNDLSLPKRGTYLIVVRGNNSEASQTIYKKE